MIQKSKNEKLKIITLGCKVNQYESQAMVEAFEEEGILEAKKPAEEARFVIVNTCTVTSEADRSNRYWIRRMKRENPQAKMIVTGCYVEKNRDRIASMPEVDLVLSNYEKDDITNRIFEGCAAPEVQNRAPDKTRFTPLQISKAQAGRTRAYIKIQDGCNHACSFCKVVLVRGRSRSRELEDIRQEAIRLAGTGVREIVLTGIQLGAYGLDFEAKKVLRHPKARDHYFLSDVMEMLSAITGIERIRLSSIEPMDLGDPLLKALERWPKFCPHLHIPLQSGDSGTLRRMNRRYRAEDYVRLIDELRRRIPDFSLTLDVMAGFPDVGESAFSSTLDVLETVRPLKCHVFPYSPREGTKAYAYPALPAAVLKERTAALIALSERIGEEEKRRYLDRDMDVLVERKRGNFFEGLTKNYLKVLFPFSCDVRGKMVSVRLLALDEGVFLGEASQQTEVVK